MSVPASDAWLGRRADDETMEFGGYGKHPLVIAESKID
jgi:hypothetical protein